MCIYRYEVFSFHDIDINKGNTAGYNVYIVDCQPKSFRVSTALLNN